MSKDRDRAVPQVMGKKYVAWIGDDMFKFDSLEFKYTTEPRTGARRGELWEPRAVLCDYRNTIMASKASDE